MTALSFSLTQLQYFVTAAHTLNLTQAARECHVSQPSISGAVHHLEETFQTELFYRDPSRGFVVRHSGGRAFRLPVRRRAGSPDQRPRISPRPGLTLFPFPKTPAWGEGASAPRISPMPKMQGTPLRR